MMKTNPYFHAVGAALYIALVVSVIKLFAGVHGPDETILGPLVMISLFTLSAAVMGYIFLATPLRLYLEGQKQEAFKFFGQTVGAFAILVVVLIVSLLVAYGGSK